MKFLLSVVAFLLFPIVGVNAQRNIVESLQANSAGEGTVTVHQDAQITKMIGERYVHSGTGQEKILKMRGFRVQVYAGNNSRQARSEAHNVQLKVQEKFPDIPVYTYFQPPRWLCRVGDYKTIEEAHSAMRMLKATGVFKEVSIVREQINIPIE